MLAFTALIAVLPFLASVTAAPTKRATGVIRFGTGNQCLVATGASNGALVNLGDCNGASTWDINRGDGLVRLSGSNFCLDAGSNPSNNVRAKVWTCYPGLGNQQWYYTDDNRIAITGGNQCLDSGPEGPQTYQCTTGNTNQVWTTGGGPTPSSSASSSGTPQPSQSSTPTGGKQIHPYGDEKLCLQILNGQIYEGAPIIVNPCADAKSPIYGAQTWDIARGNGLVRLRGTDYCFDAGSVPANANPGKIWRCDGSLPQQNWYYTDDNHIAVTGGDQCFNVRAESGQSYAKPYGSLKNTQTWLCSGPDQNQVFTTTDA